MKVTSSCQPRQHLLQIHANEQRVRLSQGAFWGLMSGLVVGLIRMVLEFSYPVPSCGLPDNRPAVLADVHYLYFALILLAFTSLITVIVSMATPPIAAEHVSNGSLYF